MVANALTHSEEDFSLGVPEGSPTDAEDNETIAMNSNFELAPNPNEPLLQIGGIPKHISYEALRANTIPCSKRGRSYYDCRNKTIVNPYRRGCTAITNCKRYTD